MMTSAQVVQTSANVTSHSPSQDYTYTDDHNLRTYEILFSQQQEQSLIKSRLREGLRIRRSPRTSK